MTTNLENPKPTTNDRTMSVVPRHWDFALTCVLLCFFLSGAAGLIYRVAWGKALGLIFGHTAYAVATVLAVFMSGLAAGAPFLAGPVISKTGPAVASSAVRFASVRTRLSPAPTA